jgi:hypothetical protein
MRPFRWVITVAFAFVTATLASAAEPKDPLARARLLYNDRQFNATVTAAAEGGGVVEEGD